MIRLGSKLRRLMAAALSIIACARVPYRALDNGLLAKSDDLSDLCMKEWHYARIPRFTVAAAEQCICRGGRALSRHLSFALARLSRCSYSLPR